MKYLLILVLFFYAAFTNASEKDVALFVDDNFGIEVVNGISVSEVKAENSKMANNKFVAFELLEKNIIATALLYKDERNPYPLTEDFGRSFVSKSYASQDATIQSELLIETQFNNVKVPGWEFRVDVIENDKSRCHLVMIHAIGNRSYMFSTVDDMFTSNLTCAEAGRNLTAAFNSIAASINVVGL